MRKPSIGLALAALVVGSLCVASAGRADDTFTPAHVQVTYHQGPLLQHVKVAMLFWGRAWEGSPRRDYLTQFFQALFLDGRYMANLAQYSAGGYQIGNGQLVATATDPADLPMVIDDTVVPAEIARAFQSGALPKPDADTLYVVFTPAKVTLQSVAFTRDGVIAGYHTAAVAGDGSWFPYAIIPTPTGSAMAAFRDAYGIERPEELMTMAASHELAEAVTDPETTDSTLGWNDDDLGTQGEVGDIPVTLWAAQQIQTSDLLDHLTGPDGTPYLVQKIWSQQDHWPVAFATPLQ